MIAFQPATAKFSAVAFPTELGWMAGLWQDDTLAALVFGHTSATRAWAALGELPPATPRVKLAPKFTIEEAADQLGQPMAEHFDLLCRYAAGEPIDLAPIPLALGKMTPFQAKVVRHCRAIPWGGTLSYGQLAKKAGSAGAARAVGTVMSRNRLPLVIPCHRVLGSGGCLGGYSAPGGLATKKKLLSQEGSL